MIFELYIPDLENVVIELLHCISFTVPIQHSLYSNPSHQSRRPSLHIRQQPCAIRTRGLVPSIQWTPDNFSCSNRRRSSLDFSFFSSQPVFLSTYRVLCVMLMPSHKEHTLAVATPVHFIPLPIASERGRQSISIYFRFVLFFSYVCCFFRVPRECFFRSRFLALLVCCRRIGFWLGDDAATKEYTVKYDRS